MGHYAVNWKLSAPASLKDQFVTVEDLRQTDRLEGQLNIFVYLKPSSDLYVKLPGGRPAGVFTYRVEMQRMGDLEEETRRTVYPFVYRFDGPVELDKYFGY